jgi:hypothetical protein
MSPFFSLSHCISPPYSDDSPFHVPAMKYAIGVHHRLFPGRPASQRGTLLVRNNCYGQTLLVINKQEKNNFFFRKTAKTLPDFY